MTKDCLRLVISSSCSWQRRISWCRPVRSSAAHVDRNRFFVSSATSIRASILTQGVCAASSTLVMWLPLLSLWRSFWLGRNQFTRRCRNQYVRFKRSTSSWVSCRSCLCLDHREFLPFLHREFHSRCSFLVRRTSSILSSFTSLFS